MNRMAEVRMIPISELKLADYNPRKELSPQSRQYRQLKKSIEELGFAESIVVNQDMTVIGGHMRIRVASSLGYTELPCTVVNLDKAEEKKLNIALNKIDGVWDEEKLAELLNELDDGFFDLSVIGFEAPEVDEVFSNVYSREIKPERFDIEKEFSEEPISRRGDLWELGRHRILCGDATEWRDYVRLMGETKADLVCIDSPYFVNLQSSVGTIMNDNLSVEEAKEFLSDTFRNLYCCMKDDASIYAFFASTRSRIFFDEFEDAGFKVGGVPVWVKDHAPVSRTDYKFQHEPIIYGWKAAGKHYWYGGKKETTVLQYPGIRSARRDGYKHPSCKPLQLIAYLVRMSSRQKGIVVDSFLGSGTTLIACEQQNRICCGMELDPRYIDVSVRRFIANSGEEEVYLVRNGERLPWKEALRIAKKV